MYRDPYFVAFTLADFLFRCFFFHLFFWPHPTTVPIAELSLVLCELFEHTSYNEPLHIWRTAFCRNGALEKYVRRVALLDE